MNTGNLLIVPFRLKVSMQVMAGLLGTIQSTVGGSGSRIRNGGWILLSIIETHMKSFWWSLVVGCTWFSDGILYKLQLYGSASGGPESHIDVEFAHG